MSLLCRMVAVSSRRVPLTRWKSGLLASLSLAILRTLGWLDAGDRAPKGLALISPIVGMFANTFPSRMNTNLRRPQRV